MWKALLVVAVMALLLVTSVQAAVIRPNPIREYRMAPGPKTYSTHQWVKGFKPAPQPSYLDRRK